MTVTSIQSILRSNLPRGPVGSTGFTGSEGFTGSQGFTGSRGEGFTIDGAVLTEQDLANIVNPQLGDVYLVEQTGEVWIYDGQQFTNIGQFVGYTGSQGDQGYTGSQGDIGYTGSQGDIGYTGSAGGVTYTVTNSGASDYLIAGAADPTLTLVKGATYYFSVNAPGHPFWIKTEQVTGTGSNYTSGVTNNGVDSGIVTFSVPFDAPSTLYYICQFHGSMSGILNIVESIKGYTGSQGELGYTGSQGEIGYTGSQGDTGFAGSIGDLGYTGSQGVPGASVRLLGSVATVQDLPSTPDPGDGYLVISTGDLFIWNGSSWTNVGKITGETGPIGFTGSRGDTGFAGSVGFAGSQGELGYTGSQGEGFTGSQGEIGYTGSQGPSGTSSTIKGAVATPQDLVTPYLGSVGDGYIVESTGDLYVWDGSQWFNIGQIVGPTGFTGSQGVGFTGSQGAGFTGSRGESTFTWGPNPPENPAIGDRWFDTVEGALSVYVDDGNSLQWVEVSASGFLGRTGFTGSAGIIDYENLTQNIVTSGTIRANNPFFLNPKVITENYTIPSNTNAMSAGPIEIALGVTVIIGSGAEWSIV